MPFRTVIFDLDGTILDTLPDLVNVTNTTIGEWGYPPRTEDEIHSFIGGGGRLVIKLSVPEDTPEEQIDAMFDRWKELYKIIGVNLTEPFPGMPETLQTLHDAGIGLGILSNKVESGVFQARDAFYPDLFAVAHGDSEGIPRKPNPKGLIICMEELGADPKSTLYVGDSWRDQETIDNIRAAGYPDVKSALCVWGYTPREKLENRQPDYLLEKPEDLLAIVLG